MQDKGMALALKAKRRNSKTSMAVGIDLVKTGEADAFVTAGNTGGAMATAYFRLETIPGVERPALTAIFPVKDGYCIVLDIGANPDCKPEICSNLRSWVPSMPITYVELKIHELLSFPMARKLEKVMNWYETLILVSEKAV